LAAAAAAAAGGAVGGASVGLGGASVCATAAKGAPATATASHQCFQPVIDAPPGPPTIWPEVAQ
jgi:hypothetical protein